MRADLLAAALAAASVVFVAAAGRDGRRRALLGRVGCQDPEVAATRPGSAPSRTRSRRAVPLAATGGAVGGWVVAGPAGSVAGAGIAIAALLAVRRRSAARKAALLETQLADAIAAVAAGVRGGLSTTQAVALAAERTPEPLAGSLHDVVVRTNLGSSLDDALDRWATAVPIPDVRLAAAVLRLHRGTGGGFPVVLDGLARTLRERRAAVREVRSLTAQARLSGAILGLLPVGFFLFLWATSRRDMTAAFGSPVGRTAIAAGVALQAIAFLWIRRLLRVEG